MHITAVLYYCTLHIPAVLQSSVAALSPGLRVLQDGVGEKGTLNLSKCANNRIQEHKKIIISARSRTLSKPRVFGRPWIWTICIVILRVFQVQSWDNLVIFPIFFVYYLLVFYEKKIWKHHIYLSLWEKSMFKTSLKHFFLLSAVFWHCTT